MSDPTGDHVDVVDEELESDYKPPPERSIEEILEADKEDESLRKYKETLLGEAKAGGIVVGEFFFFYICINVFRICSYHHLLKLFISIIYLALFAIINV